MKQKKSFPALSVFCAILAFFLLSGCAARKALWGDPETGLILEYRLDKGKALDYQVENKMVQSLEVMGNAMQTEINSGHKFTLQSRGKENEDLLFNVKINDMSMSVKSMMGDMSPDVSSVIGKSFTMLLSPLGRESGLAGADSITYDFEPGGKRGISSEFQNLFPNLAGRPLKIGDTWTYPDTINMDQGKLKIAFILQNVNTLAGLETVSGMECVKVNATVTGTVQGEGEQMGQNMVWDGEMEAKDTWYFAYREGVLVQTASEGFMEATIAISGAQNMTIPMTMEMDISLKLIK